MLVPVTRDSGSTVRTVAVDMVADDAAAPGGCARRAAANAHGAAQIARAKVRFVTSAGRPASAYRSPAANAC